MIEALLLAADRRRRSAAALAYVYCDGASLSTLNFATFSQVAFDFRVTPRLFFAGARSGRSSSAPRAGSRRPSARRGCR